MTRVRLVASDLDGTVIRPDGTMSARTLAAFAACEERGVDVVFVTGRPTRWMAPVARETGHRGIAVCSNGAVVYDLGAERVVRTRALSGEDVRGAVAALRAVLPGAAFALETLAGFRREPGFLPRHELARAVPAGTLEELLQDDPTVVKLLCRDGTSTADPMLALARPALHGIAEPVHSNSADSMVEIAALGVSKASTLAEVAAERSIDPAEVVAFGDMPNDVPMLRWAGLGVAVADAHPEALEAAAEVAPPCEQDGVAQVLERLLAHSP